MRHIVVFKNHRLFTRKNSCPAITFSDLIGKLDLLRVSCEKCGRDGCYGLRRLIAKRGRDGKLTDWLGELTAECPKKIAHNMNDPGGARCRDLVL